MAFGLKSSMVLFAPGIRSLKDKKEYEFAFHPLRYRRKCLVCQVFQVFKRDTKGMEPIDVEFHIFGYILELINK